jgi:hypothetical protein
MLEMVLGEARISHDNGTSWEGTDTGQSLQSGDRIQVASGGIALIHLQNGGLFRLEGPTDFILQMAEGDPATGRIDIIGLLWSGRALFQTPPLLTADSKFQLQVMTGLLHARYDAELADAFRAASGMPDDLLLVGGGFLDEDMEIEGVVHFQGPVSLVEAEQAKVDFPMLEHRADGRSAGMTVTIPYREDVDSELAIEAFLPTAGFLITGVRQNPALELPNAMGYILFDLGAAEAGEEAYLAAPEADALFLETLLSDPANGAVLIQQYRPSLRSVVQSFRYATIPDILSANSLILLQNSAYGCDPTSGAGCPLPDGCDPDGGAGCGLAGGCNPVTGEGCVAVEKRVGFTDPGADIPANDGWRGSQARLAQEPLCDVAVPGDCGRIYNADLFMDDFDDEEDIAWCWCRAKVPPGWPPPPPGMNMYYRCWCSDLLQ